MRDTIDVKKAIRLYEVLRNWRKVSALMIRKNGMRYTADAIQHAVGRHDAEIPA